MTDDSDPQPTDSKLSNVYTPVLKNALHLVQLENDNSDIMSHCNLTFSDKQKVLDPIVD